MTLTLKIVLEDGREEAIRDYDSFEEAVADALELADTHGSDNGEGYAPLDRIRVDRNDRPEFSVKVFPGGLVTKSGINDPDGAEPRSKFPRSRHQH